MKRRLCIVCARCGSGEARVTHEAAIGSVSKKELETLMFVDGDADFGSENGMKQGLYP